MPDCPTLRLALPVPLPQLFDYLPPVGSPAPEAGDVGRRLRVPFGPRELVGVVEAIGHSDDPATLRPALQWLDDAALIGGELSASLRWLARYTHAPLGEVIATALPAPLRRGEPLADTHGWAWELTEAGRAGYTRLRSGTRPQRLASLLLDGPVNEDLLDDQLEDWRSAARALSKREHARRIEVAAVIPQPRIVAGPVPNPQQQEAIDALQAAEGFQPFCSMASPAAARPRSTCRPSAIACSKASRRWCWYRRSA